MIAITAIVEPAARFCLRRKFFLDFVAHALWTTIAAQASRRRVARISLGWAAFWGVFPDLFSFAVPAVVRLWWYATGTTSSLLPDAHSQQHFQYVWQLYNFSHSLLAFAAVFGIVWAILRRPVLELLGWALHIVLDIPTHQGIFAVQFLWPISSFSVRGIRWESLSFMAVNYTLLLLVLAWMWFRSRRPQSSSY